nr:endo-mannanase [synthetic construct]
MKISLFIAPCLAQFALSQTGNWGQCGGENWSGDVNCNVGWLCQYSNPWYSQCVPESDSSTASGSSTSATSTTFSTSASTTSTSTTSTTSSAPSSTTTTSSSPSGYPHTSGTKFVIDGVEGYYAGTNAYWISFLTNNADVDLVMSHLQSSGMKFLRVWGFNDVNSQPNSGTVWFQLLENGSATINTGSDGLERLDYVVQSAEAHDIKLIINFVNNWGDYGGIAAYSAYQNYIKAVVSRYPTSPAIFAWELANEPRCNGCATSVITNWVSATSQYIKSIDPNRMVAIGSEGMGLATGSDGSYPFGYSEGNDFEATLAISTIDFGTIHLYPSQWGEADSWGTSWIQAHGVACNNAGKPCLLEEYGSSSHCSSEAPWQAAAIDSLAADSFWQWGDDLGSGDTPNDEYSIFYGSSDYTCLVTNHVAAI